MQEITNPLIEDYLFQLSQSHDNSILNQMEKYGRDNQFPIIDRLVGTLISTLSQLLSPKLILELGSGFGYSAYWFEKGLQDGGKIILTDLNPDNQKKAQHYLKELEIWHKMDYRLESALDVLDQEEGPFDIIYNDIDKGDYVDAFLKAKNKLKPGGLYIADNTLWFGRVVEENVTDDIKPGWTDAIKKHNSLIFNDPHFHTTLVPLRDGVLIARKIS